jgi:hypothetical protein
MFPVTELRTLSTQTYYKFSVAIHVSLRSLLKAPQDPVVIAMRLVGVMQNLVHKVVDMVLMVNKRVSTVRAMLVDLLLLLF